tara:strand:+ start:4540 stop:5427 length:888 start_codon:yes stop_codon:yes gene_type:complete
MKNTDLFERLEAELEDKKNDRGYTIDELVADKPCESCSTKTEYECDECENCNWCIVNGRWKDKSDGTSEWIISDNPVGSCVVSERYTESACSNYDENRIRMKQQNRKQTAYKENIIPFALALFAYIILSKDVVQCSVTNREHLIVYYIIGILTILHIYRILIHMDWISESNEDSKAYNGYNERQLQNLQYQKHFILFSSVSVFTIVGSIISYKLKKCAFPTGITLSIVLGIVASLPLGWNMEPSEEKSKTEKMYEVLGNKYVFMGVIGVLLVVSMGTYESKKYKKSLPPMRPMGP